MNASCRAGSLGFFLLMTITSAQAAPPEWKSLFDGNSLEGFDVILENEESQSCFTVKDGVIRTYPNWAEGTNPTNGMLITKKSYSHFHLRWEYRYDGRHFRQVRNSGVLYHVQDERIWPVCVEFQLMEGKGGWPVFVRSQARITADGLRYDPSGSYQVVGELGITQLRHGAITADKPIGQWNQAEVLVRGDNAVHVVNGQVVARFDRLKGTHPNERQWQPLRRGRIAFQCEGAGIEFRNIEIHEITMGD